MTQIKISQYPMIMVVTMSQAFQEQNATLPDMAVPQKIAFNPDTLKKIRKNRGWTQIELSGKSGVSFNTISRLEKNKTIATEDILMDLGEALNVIFTCDWTEKEKRALPERENRTRKDSKPTDESEG